MSRLTRDGTAEPGSRDQILKRERGQWKKNISPLQLTTSRIGNLTQLMHTLLNVTIHTVLYVHTILSEIYLALRSAVYS